MQFRLFLIMANWHTATLVKVAGISIIVAYICEQGASEHDRRLYLMQKPDLPRCGQI